jgi:hypothetical protein
MGNIRILAAWLMTTLTACGAVKTEQLVDASIEPDDVAVCEPETDGELCERNGATCGSVTAIDNCGDERTTSCGGACPAVCSNLEFTQSPFVPEINDPSQQDVIVGNNADGTTILNQRRSICFGAFTLLLIDGVGTRPLVTDLTTLPNLAVMNTERESAMTMTADGLTILGVNRSDTGLVASTRSAIGNVDFSPAAAGNFAAIAVVAPGFLSAPVLSADGLELYYQVLNLGPGVDGIYASVRTSTSMPFANGTRLTDPFIAEQHLVTGISSDRRSLFLQGPQGMFVLTRDDVSQPFTNTAAPALPPQVPGFRTRPLGDCQTLIGTCTGGCTGEETCRFDH